jgi:hypothetical protein
MKKLTIFAVVLVVALALSLPAMAAFNKVEGPGNGDVFQLNGLTVIKDGLWSYVWTPEESATAIADAYEIDKSISNDIAQGTITAIFGDADEALNNGNKDVKGFTIVDGLLTLWGERFSHIAGDFTGGGGLEDDCEAVFGEEEVEEYLFDFVLHLDAKIGGSTTITAAGNGGAFGNNWFTYVNLAGLTKYNPITMDLVQGNKLKVVGTVVFTVDDNNLVITINLPGGFNAVHANVGIPDKKAAPGNFNLNTKLNIAGNVVTIALADLGSGISTTKTVNTVSCSQGHAPYATGCALQWAVFEAEGYILK